MIDSTEDGFLEGYLRRAAEGIDERRGKGAVEERGEARGGEGTGKTATPTALRLCLIVPHQAHQPLSCIHASNCRFVSISGFMS